MKFRHAMQFMQGRLAESITLCQPAGLVHLSVSRFSHLFRAQAGGTPPHFLETERIELAPNLLVPSGQTISGVAEAVRYDNPFRFARRLKKRWLFAKRMATA